MSIKFRCRSTDRCVFFCDVEWTKSQAHVYRPHNEPLTLSLKGNPSADGTGTVCRYKCKTKQASTKFIITLALINMPKYRISFFLSLCDEKHNKRKPKTQAKKIIIITEMKVLALHFNLPGDSTLRSADRH